MSIQKVKTRNLRRPMPGKLAFKLAAPTIVILLLLCYGIYLGSANRESVIHFEREYLGMNAENGKSVDQLPAKPIVEPQVASIIGWNPPPAQEPQSAVPQQQLPQQQVQNVPEKIVSIIDMNPPPRTELISLPERAATGQDEVVPLELDNGLRINLDLPVTIRVKVLVDEKYLAHHPDWMTQIQSVIGEASRIYRDNFGIDISLVGLGRWPVATEGRNSRQLYNDLVNRPREGADVLLGYVDRELDGVAYYLANTSKSSLNGAFGIVGKKKNSISFLNGTLRSISHLLGAEDVVDEDSEEFQLGTWMSNKSNTDDHSPWIDAMNRRRVLKNKTRPFALVGRKDS